MGKLDFMATLLTFLQITYLNSMPKEGGGVTFNGLKHKMHCVGDTVDTALAA